MSRHALVSAIVAALVTFAISYTWQRIAIARKWSFVPAVWPGTLWAFLLALVIHWAE